MVRPMQTVKVFGVQDRCTTAQAKLPWVVRYAIDGRHRSKSFRTRIEAERYRGSLLQAVQAGDRFDVASGEPESWQPALRDVGVHEWARRWLNEQWSEWQPRTRTSGTEALALSGVLDITEMLIQLDLQAGLEDLRGKPGQQPTRANQADPFGTGLLDELLSDRTIRAALAVIG